VATAHLTHTEQPLTDEEFATFAGMFRRAIPESFRAHYLADNGGFPSEEDVEAGRWGLPVQGFVPVKYGRVPIERLVEDLERVAPHDQAVGVWVRYSYVPFAYDAGGNTIFLSLRDSDYGRVYIYAPDGGNIKEIAPSFAEFRRRLYQARSR